MVVAAAMVVMVVVCGQDETDFPAALLQLLLLFRSLPVYLVYKVCIFSFTLPLFVSLSLSRRLPFPVRM